MVNVLFYTSYVDVEFLNVYAPTKIFVIKLR